MPKLSYFATVVEHAIDNRSRADDYEVLAVFEEPRDFCFAAPKPCDVLPRQFGFWFHVGPGFAPLEHKTSHYTLLGARKVRILGADGVPVFRGGWVDSMTLHYARGHLPGCQFQRDRERINYSAPSRHLTGRYFLGYNAGHSNYAHFTTDQLPLLQYYKDNYLTQGVRLLMPANAMAFSATYLELLGIPTSAIDRVGDEVIEVEELIFASIFSFDAIPYAAVDLLQTVRNQCLPSLSFGTGRRIFISRRETTIRPLLNEESLTARLAEAGVDVIIPGKMNVLEQIAAFYEADVIIGTHGAALANLMWCRPGTHVLELFPEYAVSAHFWMLASHFDLNYGCIFGTSFDQDIALSDQSGSWGGPFVVDERAVTRYLADLSRKASYR